jgi:hypothetical protein
MFNIYNKKSRRVFTVVIAIVLVLSMVVPTILSFLI